MSIWQGLDRANFEHQLAKLYALTRYPADPTTGSRAPAVKVSETLARTPPQGRELPLEVEARLADDLAFLAAWQSAPSCVTAVTVGFLGERQGLVVAVAANEGVAVEVREAFAELCGCVRSCASLSASRQDCVARCFDVVVRLNRNRIFGRLGSAKHRKYKRAQMFPAVPVAERLASMIAELSRRSDAASRVARGSLPAKLRTLRAAIRNAESAPHGKEVDALKAVVEAAAALVDGSISLTSQLENCGFSAQPVERREIRQIKAIARYWNACSFLVSAARSYRDAFEDCRAMFLEAPPVEIWPAGSGNKHFVHAEMQLLFWHEMAPDASIARYIGVSKKTCFLCNSMITAYGKYEVASTHGELHIQWRVPEQCTGGSKIVIRLRKALSSTHNDVVRALVVARATKPRRAPPVQSAANSCSVSLRTASMSTIKAMAPHQVNSSDVESSTSQLSSKHMQGQVIASSSTKITEQISEKSSTATLKAGSQDQTESLLAPQDSPACQAAEHHLVSPGETTIVKFDWLELYIQLDQAETGEETKDVVCRVSERILASVTPEPPVNEIDVQSLAVGEQLEHALAAAHGKYACLIKFGTYRQAYLEISRKNAI